MNTQQEELKKRLSVIESEAQSIRKIIEDNDNPKNIMDVIKTFQDACDSPHVTKEELAFLSVQDSLCPHIVALCKITVISKALNEGKILTLKDDRYYPYFDVSSGFVFRFTYYGDSFAHTSSASRLCFKTEKLAAYAGTQFPDEYKAASV